MKGSKEKGVRKKNRWKEWSEGCKSFWVGSDEVRREKEIKRKWEWGRLNTEWKKRNNNRLKERRRKLKTEEEMKEGNNKNMNLDLELWKKKYSERK